MMLKKRQWFSRKLLFVFELIQDPNAVVPINIVDSGSGGFDLNLISRKEDTQVIQISPLSSLMTCYPGEGSEELLCKSGNNKG